MEWLFFAFFLCALASLRAYFFNRKVRKEGAEFAEEGFPNVTYCA
jgi:hypothetical protein